MKKSSLLLLVLSLIFCGCAGPKVAIDLLANVERQETPLTTAASTVSVTISPDINNREQLDDTVKQSLEIALADANIFGTHSASPYRIEADILGASQSPMSFGSFEGTLDIQYVVHDADGQLLLDEKIHTVAGADQWSFSGAARHRRSRAVNISKNVLQFVDHLVSRLQE